MAVVYLPEYSNFAVEIEGTEGTAEVLAAADAKPIVGEPSYDPDIPFFERPGVRIKAGGWRGTSGGPQVAMLSAICQLTGSGAAGTPPAEGDILRSMALAEAITGGTSVIYTPTIGGEAITAAWYAARNTTKALRQQIFGARSRGTITLANGQPAQMRWESQGCWQQESEENVLAPTYLTTGPVAMMGGTFSLDGVEHEFETLEINIENEFGIRHAPKGTGGIFSVIIAKQTISGSIDPNTDDPATYSWFAKMLANNEGALSIPLGSVPGNIITITAPKVQYRQVKRETREGHLISVVELQFNANVGDDALSLAYT